jgi:hypothetical protein
MALPRNPGARQPPGALPFAAGFLALSAGLLALIGRETVWLPGKGVFPDPVFFRELAAQPRFWPAVALGGMVLFGALHLRGAIRGRSAGVGREAALWVRTGEYALWYMAYVAAVPRIGYLPASLVFPVLLALRAGYRGRLALGAAAAIGLASVLFFKTFLGAKIPGGAVYEFLPETARNFMITWF